jgi:hypothetical protein
MKHYFGKYFYLIPLGLLIVSVSQILFRFIEISDLVKGLCFGLGIGIMLLAFIKRDIKHAKN